MTDIVESYYLEMGLWINLWTLEKAIMLHMKQKIFALSTFF